jgi:predicted secreted protein
MKLSSRIFVAVLGTLALANTFAQNAAPPEPRNTINLSASASTEVAQDLLTLSLSTTKEGTEPAAVQTQVRQALDAAVTEAKKATQAGAMDVRTGTISLQPRYGRDSKISGWVGSAELILEGHDFARIGTAAGKVQTMTIANAFFSLSREARLKAEAEVQSAAIERFKARAGEVSKSFGFTGYTLREVSVSGDDQASYATRPRMVAMSAKAVMADAAPMPMESGKSTVVISVNGSVVLK